MLTEKNIVLFGFMGTGKTAVARALGEELGRPVVEMDKIIEEEEGMTISRIFEEKGEEHFRRRERELVKELSRSGGRVITTGGGVVLNPDNIKDFHENGILICLTARPKVILERVEDETHRPLLEVKNLRETIEKILSTRRPFYERVYHQIDTSDLSVNEVVNKISAIIKL